TSGPSSKGTIFRMTEDGSLTTLHFFNGNDGANPCLFSLVQAESGTFFGVAFFGGLTSSSVPPGTLGRGTIFQITSNGVFTLLVRFDGTNGSNPVGLTFGPDGNLYGACNLGGDFDQGTVFRMT